MAEVLLTPQQLDSAVATLEKLYTVPAGARVVVSRLIATNRNAAPDTLRVQIRVGGAASDPKQYIAFDISLNALDSQPIRACTGITLGPTDEVWVYSLLGDTSWSLHGVEVTTAPPSGLHAPTHQHGGVDELVWSIVSPGSLGANQNDWVPGNGDIVRITSSVAVNITGLAGGISGRHRRFVNIGANNITLKHQDAGSAAGNRFRCQGAADVVLFPDEQVDLWYDATDSRWRAALI